MYQITLPVPTVDLIDISDKLLTQPIDPAITTTVVEAYKASMYADALIATGVVCILILISLALILRYLLINEKNSSRGEAEGVIGLFMLAGTLILGGVMLGGLWSDYNSPEWALADKIVRNPEYRTLLIDK